MHACVYVCVPDSSTGYDKARRICMHVCMYVCMHLCIPDSSTGYDKARRVVNWFECASFLNIWMSSTIKSTRPLCQKIWWLPLLKHSTLRVKRTSYTRNLMPLYSLRCMAMRRNITMDVRELLSAERTEASSLPVCVCVCVCICTPCVASRCVGTLLWM
jgi:hypothetical protein